MRRMMMGTGWKMNFTIGESVRYLQTLIPRVAGDAEIDIFVVPSFTALAEVGRTLHGTNIGFGAQNMFWEERGAYTGEISPGMVAECGCRYVEMGHWERRRLFAETDEHIGKKARSAWNHGLVPIICFGEAERASQPDDAIPVLTEQLGGALGKLTPDEVARTVLAYEPAWAIGVEGQAAQPEYAAGILRAARSVVRRTHGEKAAEAVRMLYGGSVNLANAAGYLADSNVDGLFVGRAALDPEAFARLVRIGVEHSRLRETV